MITVYRFASGRIEAAPWSAGEPMPGDAVWIDALAPAEEERRALAAATGLDLPTRSDMEEIEASSQLYTENGICVLTAPVVARGDTAQPVSGPLTFVLTPRLLVTLRYVEPRSIPAFAARLQRQPQQGRSAAEAMLGLLDVLVDRTADVLEIAGDRVEKLSRQVFGAEGEDEAAAPRRPEAELRSVLTRLGRAGDLVGKVGTSLSGLNRMAAYVNANGSVDAAENARERLRTVSRDLRSLEQHADFQTQRITFLLDATLGLITAQQNDIIKIFSLVTGAFVPPTLIASIYGMNFDVMPELHWRLGYPLAILLMVLSGALPLWYFRRRGWL